MNSKNTHRQNLDSLTDRIGRMLADVDKLATTSQTLKLETGMVREARSLVSLSSQATEDVR